MEILIYVAWAYIAYLVLNCLMDITESHGYEKERRQMIKEDDERRAKLSPQALLQEDKYRKERAEKEEKESQQRRDDLMGSYQAEKYG